MNELVALYEKETGKEAETGVTATFQGTSRQIMFFTDEYVEWLEALLTWRDVSDELPSVEKDGDAVMGRHKDVDEGLIQVDCISTIWFLDNYERWFTHWLPIPPAPEGE